jgi:hypothetical protein
VSVPRDLFNDYLKFSRLRSEALATKKLDLSDVAWFYPTLLLPLGIFKRDHHDIQVIPPRDYNVSNYFRIITESSETTGNRSYIPIIKLPEVKRKAEEKLRELNYFAASECGGINALQFFIGELTENIYEHSGFSTAYVMAQKYPTMRFLEFCIVDDGITIPGSYEKAGIPAESDKVAIDNALKGRSTKLLEVGERGFGLSSSIEELTKDLGGICLIVSRKGGLRATNGENDTFNIEEKHNYTGTLISIMVPFQKGPVEIKGRWR